MAEEKQAPWVTLADINELVKKAQYAVRGAVVAKAEELEQQLKKNPASLPFKDVVYCNIGNPQSVGQIPITFFRQVLALVDCPDLLKHPKVGQMFPPDVVARAQILLANIKGGTGAYSGSKGVEFCRKAVAEFITERDGYPANHDNIFLTDGASSGVHLVLKTLLTGPTDGVMIPIPQYPLYTACLALYNGKPVPYYLTEETGWGIKEAELEASLAKAKADGIKVKALVIINPGNPTGQVLSLEDQQMVCKFCEKYKIVLMADEVYQRNIYAKGAKWTSFKKVMSDMKLKDFCLASFHSVSKGLIGECGRRGGYCEFVNWPHEILEQFYKLASINLCSNLNGQIMTALMCRPPKKGDHSYDEFSREEAALLASLTRRATLVAEGFNKLKGYSCQPVQGAMYAFPKFEIPAKAIEEAKKHDPPQEPDMFYALSCLEKTGVVVVPGSGFGQKEGTMHFRTTILPPEDKLVDVLERIKKFHTEFVAKYS